MSEENSLIIIPTYNESENIGLIIPEIYKVVPGTDVLVVDDSSPDGTANCVKALSEEFSGVHLLSRARKEGLGRAYISGFKWALERDYEYIFEMDADFSHDPSYLPRFLEEIKNSDLVLGSRYKNGVNVINWPMSRLMLSYFANMVFTRIIAGLPFTDSTGGFKCFRRRVLQALNLNKIGSSGYSFQIEVNYLAWKKGFRIKEIPIIFTDRKRGESKMSTKIIREAMLLLWKLRLRSFIHRNG
ncbi:MAG: glycosyltransferase [Chitinivibrionales bacterium]|nr:glycosyltransferase [Chitinivibrionales bacterium]